MLHGGRHLTGEEEALYRRKTAKVARTLVWQSRALVCLCPNHAPREAVCRDKSQQMDHAALQHDAPDCPVTVLTVATSYQSGVHNLLASLRSQGYSYRVLAFGESWQRGTFITKMRAFAAAAAAAPRHSLVVCVDAYDVLCTRPPLGLVEHFLSKARPLLCGLETDCQSHNCGDIQEWWARASSGPVAEEKFLNSGFVMGTAIAVAAAFQWMLDAGYTDDQLGMAAFVNTHASLVAMDTASAVVRNMEIGEPLTPAERAGTGAYFFHYSGVRRFIGSSYLDAVKTFAGPFMLPIHDVIAAPIAYHYTRRGTVGGFLGGVLLLGAALGYMLGASRIRVAGRVASTATCLTILLVIVWASRANVKGKLTLPDASKQAER